MNALSAHAPIQRALGAWLVFAAWACYAPLGSKYASLLGSALCGAWIVRQQPWKARWRDFPGLLPAAALPVWLAVTALWSPAPWPVIGGHVWMYALPLLLVPTIATACPPDLARRALAHFVVASVVVALIFMLARAGWLPPSTLAWHTTTDAEGNQRIASSILLALGACLAGCFAVQSTSPWRTWAWCAAAAACLAAVTLQDRRTGMLLLPAVLLVWAVVRQPHWWRRGAMAMTIAMASMVTWQLSDGVRARFAEGVSELRLYTADDTVATSWGQRLRMWEVTAAMVAQRPLTGHGVGSWRGLWRERVTLGTALAEHSTPHNEYLLLAQQGGIVAVGLWLWLLVAALRHAVLSGAAAVPALMAWTALAWVGLFNVVLRDAKFALPLLLLAALGSAAAKGKSPPSAPH